MSLRKQGYIRTENDEKMTTETFAYLKPKDNPIKAEFFKRPQVQAEEDEMIEQLSQKEKIT